MKIIIVEDEPRSLRGIRNVITSIGKEFEITAEAEDGKKAQELILKYRPDVVFTDIKMPVMDGITLIENMQKYNLDIQWVIISAYEEFSYAQKAISLGVKEYLVKPLVYDEVEEILFRLQGESKGEKRANLSAYSQELEEKYKTAHPCVRKAVRIVLEEYNTDLNQKRIAEKFGMTQEYFSYLFRKETGCKFTDFIRDVRVDVAKTLMKDTESTILEISYLVGYNDEKYFSKIFKKATGIPPNEYRKMLL